MKLLIKTSTKPNSWDGGVTTIDYKVADDPDQQRKFDMNELPALLALFAEIVAAQVPRTIIDVSSKANSFTDAFTKGWRDGWRANGFRKRPYGQEWKRLDDLLHESRVTLNFLGETEDLKGLGYVPPAPERPGTPDEHPWQKAESSTEKVRKALSKSERKP